MIDAKTERDALVRLKRIEGQIQGIQRMVEQRKYCIDIVNQITAVRKALDQVALVLTQRHINSCVTEAIRSKHGEQKVEELMETIHRFIK